MDYQAVVVQRPPRPQGTRHSPESRYWRQFKRPVFIKEYAPVTAVHFAPAKPHRYAVTAATRVQIYAPRTQKVVKTISRFKDVARSAHLRHDGKLLVAGDDTGLVQVCILHPRLLSLIPSQVFDVNSRAILRAFDSHKQPVHVTKFSPLSPTHILSCSDDTTVKLWDIPSQSETVTFDAHSDYVRSGQVSPTNPHLVLTGSYDATMRLFDSRTGQCEMLMGSTSPGASPVEQVLMLPSGTVALSAAGPILRMWDLNAGGRCIHALSNHQKTITSLAFDANVARLLTGSLDQMVKVYDISSYKVVHAMRYPAPILSLAISVGNATSSLSFRLIPSTARLDTHCRRHVGWDTLCPSTTTKGISEWPRLSRHPNNWHLRNVLGRRTFISWPRACQVQSQVNLSG